MRIAIPENAEYVLRVLERAGYEAYIVGGCVRDSLLGKEPEDWDITTSAAPEQVKRLFARCIDTGIRHGTVTVLHGGGSFEVTTYRIDGEYRDGRHPESVHYTDQLREDLRRRDFTINAMAYHPERGLVDLFGGQEDLRRRFVRCVGEPAERFSEDALRILRAVRFSAQLDFAIEQRTEEALRQLAPSLRQVSRERIQAELVKLLVSGHPERVCLLYETGILAVTLPELVPMAQSGALARLARALPLIAPEKRLRLTVLLAQSGRETAAILRGLKFDNETIRDVQLLVSHLDWEPDGTEAAVRRLVRAIGAAYVPPLLAVQEALAVAGGTKVETARARTGLVSRQLAAILASGQCCTLAGLAVSGRDLIAAGHKPGRQLGQTLSRLLDFVIEEPEQNRRDVLLQMAARMKEDETNEGN